MGRTDARTAAMRPTLATSRQFLAAAVIIVVVGYAVILEQRWDLTRIDWISLIVAVGALAYSYWLPDSERFIAEEGRKARRVALTVRGLRSLPRVLFDNGGLGHQSFQRACAPGGCIRPRPHLYRRAQLHRACADGALQLPASSAPARDPADAVRGNLGTGHQSELFFDRGRRDSTWRWRGACWDISG